MNTPKSNPLFDIVQRKPLSTPSPSLEELSMRLHSGAVDRLERSSRARDLYSRGLTYFWRRDLHRAKGAFEQAIALGSPIGSQEYLARTLYKLGDYQNAIAHLEKSLQRLETMTWTKKEQKELRKLLNRARRLERRRTTPTRWWKWF